MSTKIYGLTEAAEILGLATATVRKWEKKGYFPLPKRMKHGKNRAVYTEEDIEIMRREMNIMVNPATGEKVITKIPAPASAPETGLTYLAWSKARHEAYVKSHGSLDGYDFYADNREWDARLLALKKPGD